MIGTKPQFMDAARGKTDFWFWKAGRPVVGHITPVDALSGRLVYTAPALELYADSISMLWIVLLVGFSGTILAALLSKNLSDKLALPIQRLTGAVAQVGAGNLGARCDIVTDDEIGLLAHGFNQMLEKIGELVESLKSEQQELTKREIALLQNRFKPHFLYNTLNTIYSLCQMNAAERAASAAKSLAEYYRYSLSGGRDVISIKEELLCVERYLEIQRLVLEDRLTVGILCDPLVELYAVPKMTIQPIVENAVLHGIKPRGSGGSLLIQAEEAGAYIRIRVMDDGVGIDAAAKERVLDADSHSGFGLKYLRERLWFYAGERAEIRIESGKDYGTTVTVLIPKEKESS
jgi:two-component system sensor histidine kinase YesM